MVIKKLINEKFLKLILAGFISYYFGLIILQYNFKAGALLGLAVFIILFLTRIEYAFYFLLTSRSIVDLLYGVKVTEGTKMTSLIGVLLISLFLYYIIVVYRHNIFSLGINKIYGIFLIIGIISLIFSHSFIGGLRAWLRLFIGFVILNLTILIVLSAGSESYKKRMNIICWTVIIAFSIPNILFLKNVIYGIAIVKGGFERYTLFGAHTNVFSYISLVVFSFCLFLYSITARNSKKILWLIFMVIIIFTIYKTYTRNVWIGLATLLLTWNILRKNFMVTFSFMVIFILMIIFNPTVQDRLKDIYI